MKFSEIKNLNETELRKKLGQVSQKIFDSKMNLSMKRLPNPLMIRNLRKDLARLQTALSHLKLKDENKKVKSTQKVKK